MTTLTPSHLPLLVAKLAELVEVDKGIWDNYEAEYELSFNENYEDGELNTSVHRLEVKKLGLVKDIKIIHNSQLQDDVKIAIKECEKLISISNALSLL